MHYCKNKCKRISINYVFAEKVNAAGEKYLRSLGLQPCFNTKDDVKFAKLFTELERYLVAAKIQGFTWDKQEYYFEDGSITVMITEDIYDNKIKNEAKILVSFFVVQLGF